MVDFRSPAVLALNSCAYHSLSISLYKLNIPTGPIFDSVPRPAQPYDGWHLPVCLNCRARLSVSLALCHTTRTHAVSHQLGVLHYSLLRMAYYQRTSTLPVDDMGL